MDPLTSAELSVHILYIRKGIDELRQDKEKQWERLDSHSTELAILKERSKATARKSGGSAGGILGLIAGCLGQFIVGFFKRWFT